VISADPFESRATSELAPILTRLVAGVDVPVQEWPLDLPGPENFGLLTRDGILRLPENIHLLDSGLIHSALSRSSGAWLRRLQIYSVIGSTNAVLMEMASHTGVNGQVRLAELQVQGRGRRGREWHSPFGANLALSMGFSAGRDAADLGGLSLVVGLALLDALERQGISGLALKWPNDLLLEGAKLGGILIEVFNSARGIELVIGVGLNIRLPTAIRETLDQAVADIEGTGIGADRNLLAAAIISSVYEFVSEFQQHGFSPFREVFNTRHYFHRAECQILQGSVAESGWVDGVTDQGALLLRSAAGAVRIYHGGEVSLRPLP
jgi:BirA family biotin operon repressor/biotin-[acetyl-CoA-carboxylase] ligase